VCSVGVAVAGCYLGDETIEGEYYQQWAFYQQGCWNLYGENHRLLFFYDV
jgi:hypothetical protein